MNAIDINCMLGNWPFRKLYKNKLEDMLNVHKKNNIVSGLVSSLDGVFFNDPYEADEDLHNIVKNTSYKQVLTVNPTLPGYLDDIDNGVKNLNIAGVRIYPCYHEYHLDNSNLDDLCNKLKEHNLPLFVSVRMEDERLDYLTHPTLEKKDVVTSFINKHNDIKIIFLTIRYAEILDLKDLFISNPNLFADSSGLKDEIFVVEKLLQHIPSEKIMYGSLHPLFCLKSTMLRFEKAEISDKDKENMLYNNAKKLFNL